MGKKLAVEMENLSVESFDTGGPEPALRGTVNAHEPCTCRASCACPTAVYYCAEIAYTVYSCDYTKNLSCWQTYQTCTPA
jgi:hypothetical protein